MSHIYGENHSPGCTSQGARKLDVLHAQMWEEPNIAKFATFTVNEPSEDNEHILEIT